MPDAARALAALSARAGLSPPRVIEGKPLGFRHRARLAVRGRASDPKIGIFELGSHRVVDIPDCQVHHPLINQVAGAVRESLVKQAPTKKPVSVYSERTRRGRIRYLQIVVERPSQTAQVVVVTADREPAGLRAFFEDLLARLGPRLHSLFWNGQPEAGNAVLGPYWQHRRGPAAVCDWFRQTRLFYPPGAFGQSHLELSETLAEHVAEAVPPGARIAEFYAGVGALGLPLVRTANKLYANEIAPGSVEGLKLGIAALPPEDRDKVGVHPTGAAEAAALVEQADVVIADPPRKGLDPELVTQLIRTPPSRFIYVACGLPALVAQTHALLDSGRFELSSLRAYNLFPYTEHVEVLAVFTGARGIDRTGIQQQKEETPEVTTLSS